MRVPISMPMFEPSHDGRPIHTLAIVDECSREYLATRVARQSSEDVITCQDVPQEHSHREILPLIVRSGDPRWVLSTSMEIDVKTESL